MSKTRYLVLITAVAFGTAVLLPRLVGRVEPRFLTMLLGDGGVKQVDRLEVGNPSAQ